MPFKKFLIKLARRILDQVLQVIQQQINRLQQEVMEEITNIIRSQLTDMWQGEDADEFAQRVEGQVLPVLDSLIGVVTHSHSGLQQAADIITRADQAASQMVSELNNQFANIYN